MKRKRNSRRNGLGYDTLETRAVLTGFHQMAVALPNELNLVTNGDFETFDSGTGNFRPADQVAGWEVEGNTGSHQINFQMNLVPYPGLGRVLDLDSTAFNRDKVYQDIATQPGRKYLISVDHAAHPAIFGGYSGPAVTPRSAEFQVWWDNTLIAVVKPNQKWATSTFSVEGGTGATSRLMFAEIVEGHRNAGDGIGALLNNVRVVKTVNVPQVNAGFESGDLSNRVPAKDVAGWNATRPVGAERVLKLDETGLPATNQNERRVLDLNAHQNFRDVAFTELNTTGGGLYYVKFLARGNGTDQLNVRWSGAWASTIRPANSWQSYGILVNANSAKSTLTFLEGSASNSALQLDNVRLYRVDNAGTNVAPTVEQLPNQSIDFGLAKTFQVVASDQDSQTLTYSLVPPTLPADHNVPTISSSGLIQWTPSLAGTHELTVNVSDSLGASSPMKFFVTVNPFVPLSANKALAGIHGKFRNDVYKSIADSTWTNRRPPTVIDTTKLYDAIINTSAGEVRIRLNAAAAPIAVNSFVALSRDGFYDGLSFHRVIDAFMAQGGDPLATGGGGPGYRFVDEVNNGLTFDRAGLLAMANAGPGTNGSQFFITDAATPWLNNNHTIFGEVTSGLAILSGLTPTHNSNNVAIPGATRTTINSINIVEVPS